MSWETRLYTSIKYNRQTYNLKEEVKEELETNYKLIKRLEQELLSLVVCTEPSKLMSKEDTENYDNPLDFITSKYSLILEHLNEYMYENFKLQFLLDCWEECHTKEGLAIEPPEGIDYNSSFLTGDFIETVQKSKK